MYRNNTCVHWPTCHKAHPTSCNNKRRIHIRGHGLGFCLFVSSCLFTCSSSVGFRLSCVITSVGHFRSYFLWLEMGVSAPRACSVTASKGSNSIKPISAKRKLADFSPNFAADSDNTSVSLPRPHLLLSARPPQSCLPVLMMYTVAHPLFRVVSRARRSRRVLLSLMTGLNV